MATTVTATNNQPGTANFPTLYKSSTYDGTEYEVLLGEDLTPKDLTNTVITCEFRKNSKIGDVQVKFTIGDGITVTDATNGIFQIDAFNVDWDSGTYYYDIQFNDSGVIKTYIQGTALVEQDVTE